MARGKTVSITIPDFLVLEYKEKAKETRMSRSRIIVNILLNEYERRKEMKTETEKE